MFASAVIVAAALAWMPAEDWVERPDPIASACAKKGGTLRFSGGQSPKSLNGYVDNNVYTIMTFLLMYESLLGNDPLTLEFAPQLARKWAISEDGREFSFKLDDRARWSDGKPITAEDVKWTFDVVMSPEADTGSWKMTLGTFESPRINSDGTITFVKKGDSEKDWRDLINCATFPILPKHAFEGVDFNKISLVGAPVSGPYQLARVSEQVESEFQRSLTWWRGNFPSCLGTCNFDRIIMRYYVDNENAFEAFKKRAIDVYPVYAARIMAAETGGEKFARNWILKRRVKNHEPIGFQGFAMNMRRKPFDDRNVRKAMSLLIDRATMNRTMMYNEYFLMRSYFTDLYDAEHPCLNDPADYNIEKAKKLLGGKRFTFTFLSRSGTEDKFLSLFSHALAQCGIEMKITRTDFAGWMRDIDSFNYDMTWAAFGASVFRNPEICWSSAEADRKGSANITGFKNPEVDRLIKAEKTMATMAERMDAYRKIDKLVTDEYPYALLWNIAEKRLLYWNKFSMPPTILSKYSAEDSILTYWWYDADKAEELESAISNNGFLPSVPERLDFDANLGIGE